jgi:predicted small lipoprotein YifL
MQKHSRANTKSALLLWMLICAIMSCGTDTPLGEYNPSSDQEAAVKSVLLDFQDGANRRDAKKVAGLIHEDAVLLLGRERRRHSKSDYLKILPQRLADQPPIAFGRPKMDMKDDTADVRIYLTRGDARILITYHLTRDDHRWAISGWTY